MRALARAGLPKSLLIVLLLVAFGALAWRPLLEGAAINGGYVALLKSRGAPNGGDSNLLEARRLFAFAQGLNPADRRAQLGSAMVDLALGDIETACAEFENLAGNRPDDLQAEFQAVDCALGRGDRLAAVEHLARAGYPLLLQRYGSTWALEADTTAALAAYTQAVELSPSDVQAVIGLSQVYAQGLRQPARAETVLRDALARGAAEGPLALELGRLLADAGRWDEAAAWAERAAEQRASPVESALLRARVAAGQRDCAEVERYVAPLLAAQPETATMLYRVGLVEGLCGDYDRAAERIARAGLLDPSNPILALALGQVETTRGNRAAARLAFERALALDPNLEPAREGLQRLQ